MAITENIGSILALVRKYKDPELMEQIIVLQNSVLELNDRVSKIDKENEDLKKLIEIQGTISVEDGVYFTENDQKRDGPFCTRCWDSNRKLIRLKVLRNGVANCPDCENVFDYQFRL